MGGLGPSYNVCGYDKKIVQDKYNLLGIRAVPSANRIRASCDTETTRSPAWFQTLAFKTARELAATWQVISNKSHSSALKSTFSDGWNHIEWSKETVIETFGLLFPARGG